jgi:membrane protease YdiL (CAAX protease family)
MEENHEIPTNDKVVSTMSVDVLPPPLPKPRKAGWWAWPLILFSLVPFDLVLAPFFEEKESEGDPGTAAMVADETADLALLKVQAQVVIASAKLDPKAAEKALDDLAKLIKGDRGVAAVALLECFIQPDSPRAAELVKEFSEGVPEELADLTDTAVRDGVGEEGREALRSHLGWFAELARGPGLSAPPRDDSIRTRSLVVLGVMGMLVILVACSFMAGVVLLILHLRRIQSGESANAFVPSRSLGGVLLECFALYLGIMTVSGLAAAFLGGTIGIAGYGLAVVIPLLWPRLRGISWREFRLAVGLHRGQGFWKEIGAGCVGYLGVLAIASIGIALTLLLSLVADLFNGGLGGAEGATNQPPSGPEVHPVVGWIYEGGLWVRLACFALAAGFAPVFEEIFFRGALHRYFRGRFRFLSSALLTGVIFAALHPQGFFAIPALAGIGVGFSLLREWRDSLIAPMTAHAINNGFLVGMLWWML